MANLEPGQRRLAAGEPPFEAPGGSDQDGEVDLLGTALRLLGVAVIMYAPRAV